MFKMIKFLFSEVRVYICRILELSSLNRKDIAYIREQVDELAKERAVLVKFFQMASVELDQANKNMAGVTKRLSSIELELLTQRGASLDNNFEGKQDL